MQTLEIPVGGAFNRTGRLYVERPADRKLLRCAMQPGTWINLHGCRAMGKTSMAICHTDQIEASGLRVIFVDVAADVGEGQSEDTLIDWVHRLAEAIAAAMHLAPDYFVNKLLQLDYKSGVTTLQHLLEDVVKYNKGRPLFLALDEYDTIRKLPYRDELILALRRIKTQQAQQPESLISRVSCCLIGWRPITQLIQETEAFDSPGTAPFAEIIEVEDFERNDETLRIMRQAFHPEQMPNDDALREVLDFSGGQPLLTMDLLERVRDHASRTPDDVKRIVAEEMARPADNSRSLELFHAISNRIATWGDKGFAVINAYLALLHESAEAHFSPGANLLVLTGLVRRQDLKLEVKGKLFEQCFDEGWALRMLSRLAANEKRGHVRATTSQKRILLINTGGTLGMMEREGQVVAPANEEEYKEYFPSLDFGAIRYWSVFPPRDSINVFPRQWATLARCIFENKNEYDSVLVVHGTDTMADTASAVAFALGPYLDFPVVFTGAQTTPDVLHGDAHVNLYRACEVAKQDIPEVVISFGNYVYRAVRAQKVDDRRFNGFESPTYPPLAEITGEITVNRKLLRDLPSIPGELDLKADFAGRIILIYQYPGMEPGPYLDLVENNQVNGIVLQTRGAGNVVSAEPYSLIPLVQKAYRKGIPVIVTSQYPPDPGNYTRYQPAQAPLEAGAIHAGNMTLGAAVAKFRWVLADVLKESDWPDLSPEVKKKRVSKRLVEESIVGEF
jgi:L-asparaginase